MINIIKILTYKKVQLFDKKKSNFNDYLTNFSILLTKFKQKTSKRPKTFAVWETEVCREKPPSVG